jgi:hypothetical protein
MNSMGSEVILQQKMSSSFKLINEILLAMNKKWTVGGMFCDLQKAFSFI